MDKLFEFYQFARDAVVADPVSGIPLAAMIALLFLTPVFVILGLIYIGVRHPEQFARSNYAGRNRNSGAVRYLLPLVLLALSAMIFNDVLNFNASKKWPVMDGAVTRSWSECSHSGRGGTTCSVYVSYKYGAYSGRTQVHDNTVLSVGVIRAGYIASRFPQGLALKVYYDPANPRRSRLEGAGVMDWRWGVFFFGFFIVSLFMMNSGRKEGSAGKTWEIRKK